MASTKAFKTSAKQPRESTTSGVNKKSKKPRETKEARERRQELAAALIITERNRAQSPLLRLPGEIRNQIYRQLIEDDLDPFWFIRKTNVFRRRSDLDLMPIQRWIESYKLTGICREMRTEFGSFLESMDQMVFEYFVHLYKWSRSASASTKRGIKSVRIEYPSGNSASTMRRYMAALRTFPTLEKVVVSTHNMWKNVQRELTDLRDIAARQGGRWKLVVEE